MRGRTMLRVRLSGSRRQLRLRTRRLWRLIRVAQIRRTLRPVFTSLGFLAAVLVSPPAIAELKIKWDCFLPNTGVDCVVLENSLTSKIPFLKVVSENRDADVVVTLTSLPAENATRFKFDFVGQPVDGYVSEVHTTDKIPNTIDSTTATVRIMTKLERGLDDFMDQKVAAEVADGKLTIQLIDPSQLPFAGRPEQGGLHWYVTPGVGAYFSDVEGVGINAAGNASLAFNYSGEKWRLQQWDGANYTRQSQPVPGTNETASVSFAGGNGNAVLSWSFTDDLRWSVGLLLAGEKNPQANYTFRVNGSVGVEFDLIPRQTVNQKNVGVRCAVGPEFQRYDATNIEGLNEQVIAREFCDVFLSWHFVPIDVGASVGETAVIEDFAYRSFSVSLSATWRVTDNLTISPWVNLQQINKAIDEAEPCNVVYADPREEIEASMRAAIQQGYTAPFGIQSGLSIRYLFGNGSLASEDQRWKTTSNLR
jgi:hypothetical protein